MRLATVLTPMSDENLTLAAQCGVTDVVGRYSGTGLDELQRLREWIESFGMRLATIEGYLPIEDIWTVKPGDVVEVQIDIGRSLEIEKEIFEGKVIYVDKTVSPVTHGARVTAEVQNKGERLVEGLYAKMTIKTGQRGTVKGAGSKPATAVRQTSGKSLDD